MITNIKTIPFGELGLNQPIIEAEFLYEKWNSKVKFHQDLAAYLQVGVVVSNKDLFVMMVQTTFKGKPTWFIRMVTGKLSRLPDAFPYPLPQIAFCRRTDERIRVRSFERAVYLARKEIQHGRK